MSGHGEMTSLIMADGQAIGVYHVAAEGARKGGLVLIQEIFGLTEHIQEQCDRFAAEGYEVVAPALFDREAPGLQASYSPEDVARCMQLAREVHPFQTAVSDVGVCIEHLKPAGPVFVVGYCYGGSLAWVAANAFDGLAAVSAYYGGLVPQFAASKPNCPTILHFGRTDAGIPLSEVAKLEAAQPEAKVFLYDAGHGFNSDRRTDYEPQSAALAFQRTLALFAGEAVS